MCWLTVYFFDGLWPLKMFTTTSINTHSYIFGVLCIWYSSTSGIATDPRIRKESSLKKLDYSPHLIDNKGLQGEVN